MQTSVTFKNLESSDSLKSYVSDKLDKLDKFLDNPAEANVVLCVEKFRNIVEINIAGDRMNINSQEETDEMYSAIEKAVDKIEKQIKKNKEKIKSHRTRAKKQSFADVAAPVKPDNDERHIRIQNIEYKPMDVEEASMQLELIPDNFLVFTNARTNRVNVLYRRNDGDFGLIQPNS